MKNWFRLQHMQFTIRHRSSSASTLFANLLADYPTEIFASVSPFSPSLFFYYLYQRIDKHLEIFFYIIGTCTFCTICLRFKNVGLVFFILCFMREWSYDGLIFCVFSHFYKLSDIFDFVKATLLQSLNPNTVKFPPV